VRLHLVDGTFELFRAFFGAPKARAADGREVGATRGILRILLRLLREDDVTHVGVAFDHVIESFRNDLFEGYKTGDGLPEELASQFALAERAAAALGLVVWPMIEFEADDAIATMAALGDKDRAVEQVIICSPDKDLTQCVRGTRVICADRMRKTTLDEAGVTAKFGVSPASIPDWLALVGDTADGIPGVPKWGAKSAATVLAKHAHIEQIPDDHSTWGLPSLRGAADLAASLRERRTEVALWKKLATLRTDVPLAEKPADLEWRGADRAALESLIAEIGDRAILERVPHWR
jgi:5'-3' exonuclease